MVKCSYRGTFNKSCPIQYSVPPRHIQTDMIGNVKNSILIRMKFNCVQVTKLIPDRFIRP